MARRPREAGRGEGARNVALAALVLLAVAGLVAWTRPPAEMVAVHGPRPRGAALSRPRGRREPAGVEGARPEDSAVPPSLAHLHEGTRGTAERAMPAGLGRDGMPAGGGGGGGGGAPEREAADEVQGVRGALGYPVSVRPELLGPGGEGPGFPAAEDTWADLVRHLNRNVSVLHEKLPPCRWSGGATQALSHDEGLPRTRLVLWALAELDAKWFQGIGVMYHLAGRTELGAVRAGGLVAHAPWAEADLLMDRGRAHRLFRRLRGVVDADDPFRHMRSASGWVRVRQDGDAHLSVDFVPNAKAFVRYHREAAERTGLPVMASDDAAMSAVREYLGPQGWTCGAGGADCSVRLLRLRLAGSDHVRGGDRPGPAVAAAVARAAEGLCRCAFAPLRTGLVCRQDAVRRGREQFGGV